MLPFEIQQLGYDYIIFDMPPVTQTSATPRAPRKMVVTVLNLRKHHWDVPPSLPRIKRPFWKPRILLSAH
jgi:hypothetical protein